MTRKFLTIGEYIEYWCNKRGWEAIDFAQRLSDISAEKGGVKWLTENTLLQINHWIENENEKHLPSDQTISLVGDALGVTDWEIFTSLGTIPPDCRRAIAMDADEWFETFYPQD